METGIGVAAEEHVLSLNSRHPLRMSISRVHIQMPGQKSSIGMLEQELRTASQNESSPIYRAKGGRSANWMN